MPDTWWMVEFSHFTNTAWGGNCLLSCPLSVSSVAQSCPTLCDPMDCSTPGFPVHHQLPEPAQTHGYWVGDAIQPSHPLSSFPLYTWESEDLSCEGPSLKSHRDKTESGLLDLLLMRMLSKADPEIKIWVQTFSLGGVFVIDLLPLSSDAPFNMWGKIPWRRQWHPTPVLLPGKSHGWRSLVGYSPWDCKESDTTERLHCR